MNYDSQELMFIFLWLSNIELNLFSGENEGSAIRGTPYLRFLNHIDVITCGPEKLVPHYKYGKNSGRILAMAYLSISPPGT